MRCSYNSDVAIKSGARSSPLSRVQVQEVLNALNQHYPEIKFEMTWISTSGDIDQKTSLRTLEKTDFFTKEIDIAILNDQYRIGIHAAKDLPSPLPIGLKLICLTLGVDPSDALVLRQGESLKSLRPGAIIATSSSRREEAALLIRNDFTFIDLRGTIGQRLTRLDTSEADGVILAEAALIRLGLTHLNRVFLPGPTVEGQGQLAIVAKESDKEIETLFACLDCRVKST